MALHRRKGRNRDRCSSRHHRFSCPRLLAVHMEGEQEEIRRIKEGGFHEMSGDYHVQNAPVEVDARSVNELPGGETRAEMDPKCLQNGGVHVIDKGDYTEAQSEEFVMKFGRVFVATSTASE